MNKPTLLFTAALLTAPALLALTACQPSGPVTNAPETNANSVTTLPISELPLHAEQATRLDNNLWLGVHPHGDIQIRDGQGALVGQQPVAAEFISQRRDAQGDFFLSLTTDNQLMFYRASAQGISDLHLSAELPWPLEGMCLYQPSAQELNLFVMDESAIAHQLLLTRTQGELLAREIRQFPLPPLAEYCVVDDSTDQLFVSEENIGVWSYNARAESEVLRKPVDLVKPWGALEHNTGPLAISQGQLLVAELGSDLLHAYPLDGGDTRTWQLAPIAAGQPLAADALTVSADSDKTVMAVLDDNNGKVYRAELTLPARAGDNQRIVQVAPVAETRPMRKSGDAADDPAIWVNQQQPELSRIIGTNKKYGLYVYDLAGNELQELVVGRVNNVDVRQGFSLKGQAADIAAASQRDRKAIALFSIDPLNGQVSTAGEVVTTLDNVYGLCMYRNITDNRFFVFINDQDGRFEQYEITDSSAGWRGKKVREFAVKSQPEGCAADDRQQRLFIGEEDVAVWTLSADAGAPTDMTQVAAVSDVLVADIEGMDIYRSDTEAYLVVSSQGNDSYVLYQAEAPYEYVGRFRVGINAEKGIDGASETDGLTVTSQALGADYPAGMLVVQDGRNLLPDENQNFKTISWDSIRAVVIAP
ncbi:phytase [Thalassolituus sp. LLYu03]|uniref:phytase n=1 Tax=Thalassolituus sp. LLYu03 TaxID=3421656 RepID=UPI003D2CE7C5